MPPADKKTEQRLTELRAEYERQLHKMQAGVAFDIGNGGSAHLPKHLRVGVNSAMVNNAAMAALLIKKGVITELEYYEQMVESMKKEADEYERELSQRLGRKVTLV